VSLLSLEERLRPDRCALVVVDMQNDFCDPAGLIHQVYHLDVSASSTILPTVCTLIDAAHAAGVPLVFTRMVNDSGTESAAFRGRRLVAGGTPVCRTGTWGAELWQFQPQASDLVIDKHRHSAFFGTDLDLRLRSLDKQSVVLAGVNTNVCVEASARDACAHDYWTIVVSDATGAYTVEEHRAALHNIDTYFGLVTDAAQVLDVWRRAG
jgi:ureidoacrylate peracid hydrolase